MFQDFLNPTEVVPLLSVWCNLRDGFGKKIWATHYDVELAGKPVKAIPFNEFKEHSKNIESLWRKAAKIAASNIIEELYPVQ